jgi:hypothetical protein
MLLILGVTEDKFLTKSCCGYKADGMGTSRDCIIIPSLSTEAQKLDIILPFGHFCGQAGLHTKSEVVTVLPAKWKTLCSKLLTKAAIMCLHTVGQSFSEVRVRKFRTLKTLRTRTQRVCLFTHL